MSFQSLLEQPQSGINVVGGPGMVKWDGTNLLKANPGIDYQFPLVTFDTAFATFALWAAINYDGTNYTTGNIVIIDQASESYVHNGGTTGTVTDFSLIEATGAGTVSTDGQTILGDGSGGNPLFAQGVLLDTTPTSNNSYSGITGLLNANQAIPQWGVAKVNNPPNADIRKANAAAASPFYGPLVLATVAIGAGTSGIALFQGIARNDSWTWTGGGTTLYLQTSRLGSDAEMTETPPNATDEAIQIAGYSLTPTVIYWNPQLVYVIHT